MHTQISGLGDCLAQDEMDGIRLCREVVSHLIGASSDPSRAQFEEPYMTRRHAGLSFEKLPDIREVVMRVVDSSKLKFKPL